MRLRLLSSGSLGFGGLILMGMGAYFAFLRPPILPEDSRYIGVSLVRIQDSVPGMLPWLSRVFAVLGGYMFATGLLTAYVAATSVRTVRPVTTTVVAIAGLASIGWMAITNFQIGSAFKWVLLAFTLPWLIALLSFRLSRDVPQHGVPR